jgi:hypothetical protein
VDKDGKSQYDLNLEPIVHAPELTTVTLPLKNGGTHDFPAFIVPPELMGDKEVSREYVQAAINWLANYPGARINIMLQPNQGRESKNLIIAKPYENLPNAMLVEKDNPEMKLNLFGTIKDGVVQLGVPWTNLNGNFDYIEVVVAGIDLEYWKSLYGDPQRMEFDLTFDLQP